MSTIQALQRDPSRFAFDAAIRVLLLEAGIADPAEAVRFVSPPDLNYPASEIQTVTASKSRAEVMTSVMGMTGPSGVLPRGYTEIVTALTRDRSPSLHAFLDMLADRFVAQFAHAGSKYRIHRSAENAVIARRPDPIGQALLALTGYAYSGFSVRLEAGEAALQHYAGFFAARPRSADRLAALASDWLGRPVKVRQFEGSWLALPEAERTRLPRGRDESSFARLGIDAAAGVRAWDLQAQIVLVVGPLDRKGFEEMLPGNGALERFTALIRAFLGFETGFAVNLVISRDAIPPLKISSSCSGQRLGWNTWLNNHSESRLCDATDAVFDACAIEASART